MPFSLSLFLCFLLLFLPVLLYVHTHTNTNKQNIITHIYLIKIVPNVTLYKKKKTHFNVKIALGGKNFFLFSLPQKKQTKYIVNVYHAISSKMDKLKLHRVTA